MFPMPTNFIIASNNRNKTRELIQIFEWFGQQAISYQSLLGRVDFPKEGTISYSENALTKANWIAQKLPGKWIVADDTGMMLEACPQSLGITTSRDLHMDQTTDSALNQQILKMVANQSRKVTMQSTLVAVNQPHVLKATGKFVGQISAEPRGNNGKSFDLILEVPGKNATLAELPNDEKIPLLHRTKAVQNLLDSYFI